MEASATSQADTHRPLSRSPLRMVTTAHVGNAAAASFRATSDCAMRGGLTASGSVDLGASATLAVSATSATGRAGAASTMRCRADSDLICTTSLMGVCSGCSGADGGVCSTGLILLRKGQMLG